MPVQVRRMLQLMLLVFLTDYENEAQYLIDTVQKKLKEKGVDLPFTLSDDEAESILGGKDSPLYKQFF